MTSLRLIGAALAFSALIATPALAWEAVDEPAAAASLNPNFSIYSNSGDPAESSRSMAFQPLNTGAMAEMRVSAKPHRVHHARIKH